MYIIKYNCSDMMKEILKVFNFNKPTYNCIFLKKSKYYRNNFKGNNANFFL